jgi:calcineurin-like phosphoesterase family protein
MIPADDVYLIEIRLGRTKWKVKQVVTAIAASSGIEYFMEEHPHVTLFGPLELGDDTAEQQVLDTIGRIAAHYDPVPFLIDRFEKREGMHGSVLAFSVRPSARLKELVAELAGALTPVTFSQNAWDGTPDQKWYHVTIANHLDKEKAATVFRSLASLKPPAPVTGQPAGFIARVLHGIRGTTGREKTDPVHPILLDETGLRITVMHKKDILAEYDLQEKCWIGDDHRQDTPGWQKTLRNFRISAGFENPHPRPAKPDDIFLIGDLHLGHANIIRYCSRPFLFSDPGEMDRVLIANWNSVVSPGTRIYHLGDLRYGSTARPVAEYREQLRGNAVFITGNHDTPEPGTLPSALIGYEGLKFFLVHDPADAPSDFDGWVVHGHHHNNDLRHYPFIDFRNRRINVSAEVAGYVPVSLAEICARIRTCSDAGLTDPVLLGYPYPH